MIQSTETQLKSVWLLGVSGAVTVTGYFRNANGVRTGNSFSGTVPQGGAAGTPVSFANIAGVAIPADAEGVRVRLSGDVYEDAADGSYGADFKTNYANYPKAIADPEWNRFGRV